MPTFDPVARAYRILEFTAFGRDLERARFAFLPRLGRCRSVLMLGEGDGRSLARLLRLAPAAHIHYVDASTAMLRLARQRIPAEDRARVDFHAADILREELPTGPFDAVTTFFILDCFADSQVEQLVQRVAARLTPNATWLFADFVMPEYGWRRRRAQIWLGVLYAFFRQSAGLAVDRLPASERLLTAAGFHQAEFTELQHGMLKTAVYRR